MSTRIGERVHGWVGAWIYAEVHEWVHGCMDGHVHKYMGGSMGVCIGAAWICTWTMDRYMDICVGEQIRT